MNILIGKKLTIPLYHGTSNLFYEDIQKHGFGGKNLIEELKVMDMLTQLYDVCITETNFKHEEPVLDLLCLKILSQEDAWQYKSLYLNSSRCKAVTHALSNKYGSEILSLTMYLYEYITNMYPSFQFNNPIHNQLADLLLEADIQPVVLRFDNMDIDTLTMAVSDKEKFLYTLFKLREMYKKFGEMAGDLFQMNFVIPYGKPISQDKITKEDIYYLSCTKKFDRG